LIKVSPSLPAPSTAIFLSFSIVDSAVAELFAMITAACSEKPVVVGSGLC
jgi:hypothetical protein